MKPTKTISIEQAVPGMELAADIFDSHNSLLMGEGTILTPNLIINLRSIYKVAMVRITIEPPGNNAPPNNPVREIITPRTDFEMNIDRALSMILHYEEVTQMAEIIKKIHRERTVLKEY